MNTKNFTIITQLTLLAVSFFAVLGISLSLNSYTIHAQGLNIPEQQTPDEFKESCTNEETCLDENPITKWVNFFINLFSVVIVFGSAAMIAVAGIQYTTSRDNPQAVQAAKQKIWNVLIGLLAFFFLYAFIQWIIPGGVF